MTPSPDIHTLTGAYAAHALTADERERFERHLRECADCAQEVRELLETTALLGTAAATPVPPQLFDRVMAEVGRTRQVPPVIPLGLPGRPTGAPAGSDRRFRRWAVSVAACLAAFAIGLGGFAFQAYRNARESEQLNERMAAVLTAPDAESVTVSSGGGSGGSGGTVTVVVSRDREQLLVVSRGLPQVPENRIYQAWMIGPSGAKSAGLMGPSGRTPLVLPGPGDANAVGVTIEPAGGSVQPTSDPVLLLRLPQA
jgi:anti-sigma-K factor RskA